MTKYVVALDQGTTSTRALVIDHAGEVVSLAQKEHRQIFPKPGWVEHDASEIWNHTAEVIGQALGKAHLTRHDIVAIGITNQRETTVIWDAATGKPVHNALVWQDTRSQSVADRLAETDGIDRFRAATGLPLGAYFAGTKITWLLENVAGLRERAEAGELRFGTMDTWLLWNLTGGVNGGVHATDVSNASRTMLMRLDTLDWDEELLAAFDVPRQLLPEIRPSSGEFGVAAPESLLRGVPITGVLGDQHASLFGHGAFSPGAAKNTYGTGCFLMVNTGETPVVSTNGLLTTVAYQIKGQQPVYGLEGAIAVTGSLIHWLRDNLELISDARETEALARTVDDNGGVYFVPAFSGLFAPYWRPDARGVIVGLTRYVSKAHIVRAALEASAFQTADVVAAANADAGLALTELCVDGGMTGNALLMQFQADVLGVAVDVNAISETTALGAAYAAGLAVGFWSGTDELRAHRHSKARFEPGWTDPKRAEALGHWHKAIERSLNWID